MCSWSWCIVYTFNFIDRQIVGILAVPIKAELHLTDSQLGLMGGLAFALVLHAARNTDRATRRQGQPYRAS